MGVGEVEEGEALYSSVLGCLSSLARKKLFLMEYHLLVAIFFVFSRQDVWISFFLCILNNELIMSKQNVQYMYVRFLLHGEIY